MVEEDKSPSSNSMQRVKVYRMSEDGKWDDQGTGHISVDYLERSEDLGLFVVNEEDNETLLLHRISSDDIYRKQEDTIISWRDPDLRTELALSFQETSGCSYIWDNLCSVQRNMHFSSLANDTIHNVNCEMRELPPVELSTLPIILKTIVDSGITEQLRLTELILHHQDFLRKLMELFRICEDSANIDGLHMIFKIIRGIILLNSTQIFEKIFGDDLIMDTIGCLEYDPKVPRVHHRDFLREHVVFKEAIPIRDPVVLSKVHQSYRVGYMKDIIFPRSMDEAVVANLNSIIHSNNAMVVSLLKDDNTFIKELFTKLKSPETSIVSRKTLVQFLHEFCTLSKSLQMVYQIRLYRDLINEGILDIIADVMQSEDKKLVLTATDILILFLNQDPNILRSYVSQQHDVLFGLLVRHMLTDFGDDMHCQFLEIIRSLLDMFVPGSQKTTVEVFYQKHFSQLIDAITSACPENDDVRKFEQSDGGSRNQSPVKPEILLNICDLLCFCVLHHPHKIKCNFLLNNMIDNVLLLTRRRERYLVAAAVKFVRTIISQSDENLMNHFVKNNLFKPIVDAFIANGNRYNLLNSAVLELFEYIRKENLKILLRYIVETFWDGLAKFEYLSSIVALRVKYDQLLECAGTSTGAGSLSDQRKQTDERGLEKEEEDYFNEGSGDEEPALAESTSTKNTRPQLPAVANGSSNPLPRSGVLVDYADDDDEDYKPPPRKITETSEDTEFKLKRKFVSKEEPGLKRLKMKVATAASLNSTLRHTVVPMKKSETAALTIPKSNDEKNSDGPIQEENGSESTSEESQNAQLENHVHEQEASPRRSDSSSDSTDNRQLGNDQPLLPTQEMAVNGS